MNRIVSYIIILWIAAAWQSCAPKTEMVKPLKLPNKSPKYLIKKMTAIDHDFDYLFAKFTVRSHLNGDKLNFKGAMRIKADSIIWISVTKLGGVEILRMVLTRDSIKFINKWEKEYFIGRLDELQDFGGMRMKYHFLEELLTARPTDFDPHDKFKSSDDNINYILSSKVKSIVRKATVIIEDDSLLTIRPEENKYEKVIVKMEKTEDKKNAKKHPKKPVKLVDELIVKNYYLYPGSFLLAKQTISLIAEQQAMEVTYDDYEMVNEKFPFARRMTIRVASKEKSSRFDIKFTTVKLNSPMAFPFKISKKYVPIEKKK